MLCYESKAITDIGNHRKINQDNYLCITDFVNNTYVGIFCVADGMGGLSDGEYASRLAVTKTLQWYKEGLQKISKKTYSKNKLKKSLKDLFYAINEEIFGYGRVNSIKIGTTYSLLLLIGNKYFVVHAGDSRIYMKRANHLYMLTKDQTWVNDQVEKGIISPAQAENHPRKNVLANCMGCFENPLICFGEGNVKRDDSFLLCSDGLYNLMLTEEISKGMSCKNIDYIADEFVRVVKQRGAYDNVTILMIKIFDAVDGGMTTISMV